MSKLEEPRAAKNSGLSFSSEKSGCATANAESAARWAKLSSSSLPRDRCSPTAGCSVVVISSALGAREVQHPRAGLQPLRALHLERLVEAALEEPELVVGVQPV